MRVLIAALDEHFVAELAAGMRGQGFTVETANDGGTALERCREVDAVLLDLVLDDVDGLETCRAIRAMCSVPIIVVTERNDEIDRLLSFKLGADDYVVRPYNLRELTVRVQAVIRRTAWLPLGGHDNEPVLGHEIGNLRVDLRRRLVVVGGRRVSLTRKEFEILALLVADPGRVFSREEIMLHVWGHDGAGDTRTLGVHMSGLRRKLGLPMLIETVRGVGFRVVTEPLDALAAEEAV